MREKIKACKDDSDREEMNRKRNTRREIIHFNDLPSFDSPIRWSLSAPPRTQTHCYMCYCCYMCCYCYCCHHHRSLRQQALALSTPLQWRSTLPSALAELFAPIHQILLSVFLLRILFLRVLHFYYYCCHCHCCYCYCCCHCRCCWCIHVCLRWMVLEMVLTLRMAQLHDRLVLVAPNEQRK